MNEQSDTPELDGGLTSVKPPIPIFRVSSVVDRYFVYDVNTALWLRRSQRILGVLIGSLPQFPQQNVFQGLPLELQSEEVRLLCGSGLALVVDDGLVHSHNLRTVGTKDHARFISDLEQQGAKLARISAAAKERKTLEHRNSRRGESADIEDQSAQSPEDESSLFDSGDRYGRNTKPSSNPSKTTHAYSLTPATSYPPIAMPKFEDKGSIPTVNPASYNLFKYLYEQSYMLSPGLRFGCQFLVYPGDPLRYHSHFLANSYEWDQEIDLLDIITGGRLGTGVKKSFLIAGTDTKQRGNDDSGYRSEATKSPPSSTRTFCIEWGGM